VLAAGRTEWPLVDGSVATVFQLLDDHSRFIVGSWVATGETGAAAVAVMSAAVTAHQAPLLLLTDNGLAMNPHRRGRTSPLAAYAHSIGTRAITSRIYHPQTCGKNERVHATLKRWLRARPLPTTLAELTTWTVSFDHYYNQHRPHQGLDMRTPAAVLRSSPRATTPQPPTPTQAPAQPKIQHVVTVKRVGTSGSVHITGSRFIGLGTEYAGSDVLTVVEDTTAAVFDHRGTHLRTVTLIPGKRYYGTGRQSTGRVPARARLHARIDPTQLPTVRST
jgi:hypothetical protein